MYCCMNVGSYIYVRRCIYMSIFNTQIYILRSLGWVLVRIFSTYVSILKVSIWFFLWSAHKIHAHNIIWNGLIRERLLPHYIIETNYQQINSEKLYFWNMKRRTSIFLLAYKYMYLTICNILYNLSTCKGILT